ncbi:MAG: hypothetical protein A3D24_00715 [Candidatus Blackburnbacteria bacterium RIFCSPHIGHO2_02_FULL_39_13]|uniref:Uncharacterized protein n=1 Tax=Candidatus Blackburnbacteria bacterium RIFCSPLOWO2_01_FULL_40_20 TaxID=1797519 RepID=A0A1G1VE12_9BACT|nr:MAG: hypothetical protein UT38_C0006G0059 [Microgenomates group bacterium GW2011_GWA2_39_19]OGY06822.1 MAG: hypothetical protein A2694_00695 [Candidatus Blackburnbacteria bacterium RIFCSPHIGHO2_01_FULL_40_17]OGY08996.1 MAG: hypothetical protein A3D24_00715 [Candidatus Blackburnbacteria bacterium RIFCSPHIGHO2_02_FULL_39_13]OGY13664.1 MAG: hypothetical protein A3A77_01265 [Candidatus Blackburnbacteria bacterium RIFCSPLOWO2_01_FULL_40_20]OGY15104.1 MAG: hypothetical protein A3I52_03200 [Candida
MLGSPEVYLSPDLHTGHARTVGFELAKRNLDILDFYLYRIEKITRVSPANKHNPIFIRENLSQVDLSLRTRDQWESAEEKTLNILRKVGVETTPEKTDGNLEMTLEQTPPFLCTEDAKAFLSAAMNRINYLLSQECKDRLDTVRHAAYFYVESRLLNMAVFT